MKYLKSLYLLLAIPTCLSAGNATWNGTTSGVWPLNVNWTPVTGFPNGTADIATFTSAGTSPNPLVTLTTPITINQLLYNTLTGGTSGYTISSNAPSSILTFGGAIPFITVDATNATYTQTISAPVILGGTGTFTINQNSTGTGGFTISGNISGSGGAGGVIYSGPSPTVLSGNNSYTGTSTIGGTLQAGSLGAFSLNSDYTGAGTLDLHGFSNSVKSIAGSLNVTSTMPGNTILTIANGGSFTGQIIDGSATNSLGLTLTGGTLTVTSGGANTYYGTTTVDNSAILQAGNAVNAFSPNSDYTLNNTSTLDLNTFSNSIFSLSGTGSVKSSSGTPTLTIANGGSFSGTITGSGLGLTLTGGTLTLSGANTYGGTTTLNNSAILQAAANNAFSSSSPIVLNNSSSVSLGSFSNTISSLASSSSSTEINLGSGTLTISGNITSQTFAGRITNTGGCGSLVIQGGSELKLTNPNNNNDWCGTTTISGGGTFVSALIAGANGVFSKNSAFLVGNSGTLQLNGFNNTILSLNDTLTLTAVGTVENVFASPAVLTILNGGSYSGVITDNGSSFSLGLNLTGGTFISSGVANFYHGITNISNDAILQAGAPNTFSLNSAYQLFNNAEMDLETFSNQIFSLASSDSTTTLNLGTGTLTIKGAVATTFAGKITNLCGNLIVTGGTMLTLTNPNNDYCGFTRVFDPALPSALIAGVNNAFSNNSNFQIGGHGVLDLAGFNNTILSLNDSPVAPFSPGTVLSTAAANAILTISNGGSFTGVITDLNASHSLGLTLTGGTLLLTPSTANTYHGTTMVSDGAILRAGNTTAFSPNSQYTVNGTLDLNTHSNTIGSLFGASTGNVTSTLSGSPVLTINGGGVYSGTITDGGSNSHSLGLELVGGIFQLNTAATPNTYFGNTTIDTGATFSAGFADVFSKNSIITMASGSFITLNNLANEIAGLNGSGTVSTGGIDGILTINNGNPSSATSSFGGSITGAGGLTISGGTVQFTSGASNSYTGPTTVNLGATLEGNSTTANTFAPGSDHTVNGTLDLFGQPNLINRLFGSGTVTNSFVDTTTLTIANGGSFSGAIKDGGLNEHLGITLNNGTLTLSGSGTNTYTLLTTIQANATLKAAALNAFSPNSNVSLTGTLDLNNNNNEIASLFGSGSVLTGTGIGGILTIDNGSLISTFSGGISGNGGINLTGGTLTLSTLIAANTYTGATTLINGAILQAGFTNALPSNSDITLFNSAQLQLAGFNNKIKSLASAATGTKVDLGTPAGVLDINGGSTTTFAGSIVGGTIGGVGGLTIDGGTILTLSNPGATVTYGGTTSIVNGSLIIATNGALSPNTSVTVSSAGTLNLASPALVPAYSAQSLFNSGTVINNGTLSLTNTFTQTAGGILNLAYGPGSVVGRINAPGGILLNGNLTVTKVPAVSETGTHVILDAIPKLVTGMFSSFTPMGFTIVPSIAYSPDEVILYFPTCNDVWSTNGNGTWGNAGNWGYPPPPGCPPGLAGNTDDVANFNDIIPFGSGVPNITVTVADDPGMNPVQLILGTLNLNATLTSFTITQFNSLSQIEFNHSFVGFPTINVTLGNHILNVPLLLGQTTNLFLTDSTSLTLNPATTLNSVGTAAFNVQQSGGSGTGTLVNDTTITPYAMNITSATVVNNDVIAPINSLNISAAPLLTATVTNLAPGAKMGPTGSNATFLIGGAGTTNVTNVGAGAMIGPTGSNASFLIGGAGTTNVANVGAGAMIGPTGSSGSMTIGGSGTTNVANLATGSIIGPSGIGGNLAIGGTGNTIVSNSGMGSFFGASGLGGNVSIGGAGSTAVTNNGVGAIFGPSGQGGSMLIGSTGPTNILNNGMGASFGPSGAGGSMTILGPTTITNTGTATKFGPSGSGGGINFMSGTFNNINGALFSSGPGSTFNISGGSITNDLTSTVGSFSADMNFSGGMINTSGNILANNYNQGGTSVLQLNLTSLPTQFGNVNAAGTAQVGSALIVDALPGSVTSEQVVDLVFGAKGRTGTYSSVSLLNFPPQFIPEVVYTPNAVQLFVTPTITPNPTGTVGQVPFTAVNGTNLRVQRELHELHRRLMDTRYMCYPSDCCDCCYGDNADQNAYYEQGPERRTEVYAGVTDNFGSFKTKGTVQKGFDFNSVGAFVGVDHCIKQFGVGVSADYAHTHANVAHHSGKFNGDRVHGNIYGEWVPEKLTNLAVEGIVGYGHEWYKLYRATGTSAAPLTARGDTQLNEFDALLGAEYTIAYPFCGVLRNRLFATPLVNVQYIDVRIKGFTESNAGIHDLSIEKQNIRSLRSCVGARFEYIAECPGIQFKTELDLGWQAEFLDKTRCLAFSTVNLPQNNTLTNTVFGAGRNTFVGGLDFLMTLNDRFEIEACYDIQCNSLYTNHGFYIQLGADF